MSDTPLPDGEKSRVDRDASKGVSYNVARARCNYKTEGDYPHRSSQGFAASAHGWWTHSSPGACPTHADVEVTLQGYLCTRYPSGAEESRWNTLDHQESRILAGGGSGRRTTARHNCISSQTVSYRSIIDVDLVDVWDGWFKKYVRNDVDCYPQ